VVLSYRHRLFATAVQEAALSAMLAAFCDLSNAALQQRIEAHRRRGLSLRDGHQAGELKAVRAADQRLASSSFSAEQQVLRRLDKTFAAFFGRLRRGSKPGFPRLRSKARFDAAEFRLGDGLTLRKTNRIGIVGIPGEIRSNGIGHCPRMRSSAPQ
jgi:putative transposase